MGYSPEFKVLEDGSLVEVVLSEQGIDEAAEQQTLAEAQNALDGATGDYNNKLEVSQNADAAADVAAKELQVATETKEQAEVALLKSKARVDAIASARELGPEQPVDSEEDGSDDGEPDEGEPEDSVATDIPVHSPNQEQPA